MQKYSVGIVHEWIQSRAGSEQTFERMALNYPHAQLFALSDVSDGQLNLGGRSVTTTGIQRISALRDHRSAALPLMPLAWLAQRTADVEVLITSSHAFNRYIRSTAQVKLSYVYTPMRYAWTPEADSRGAGWYNAPARTLLRKIDRASVRGYDGFAAISTEVARRIESFYGRSASVIFPPVEVARFSPPSSFSERSDYLLGVSRWIAYKRLDLVVAVGEALNMPVVIAGRGPEERTLRRLAAQARVPVELVQNPSDESLAELYRRARLVVFPPYEDFGIVPVEAQASGTPVVGYGKGGTVDTVIDGVTGALAAHQTLDAFVAAAHRALDLEDVSESAVDHARNFAPEAFDRAFVDWVDEHVERTFGDGR